MNNSRQHIFPWGHQRRFNAYSNYFRLKFGGRLQKVSIDAGFTCPNREGSAGNGGCSYCDNDAFNPSYCTPDKSITRQLQEGIDFLSHRYKSPRGYLAYFQAFSNTYAPLARLKSLYSEALSFPGILGLIIGTRPDCIDEEKLDYIAELSEKYFVVIEYGVESCYDRTLRRINRGHTFQKAMEAIRLTSDKKIKTGAHFIFGLPGESRTEMLDEARIISGLPLDSVKFHQLQIVKGTRMAADYNRNPSDFDLFTFEEYVEFFVAFLELLNPTIVVERFTGEAPPRKLEVQNWGKKRTDQISRIIEDRLEELDTWQGRLYNPE
ncbi:MAG TPA: TIGR01212 family radical SAM protein [Bacteroidales bacterium]|nr:TIGR01212 family radical SAM protein [Bacteroidales bacterium]